MSPQSSGGSWHHKRISFEVDNFQLIFRFPKIVFYFLGVLPYREPPKEWKIYNDKFLFRLALI